VQLTEIKKIFLFIGIGTILLIIFLIYHAVYHMILKPMEQLEYKLAEFSDSGDFPEISEAVYQRQDEIGRIAKSFGNMKKRLCESREETEQYKKELVEIILKTLHEKSPREEQHSRRVAELSERLAAAMGKSKTECRRIYHAGMLHDIGKIGISEEILNKPGRLDDEEYQLIRRHPEIGYCILQVSGETKDLSEIVLYHHERYDGRGYPKNLKRDEIPLEARIISVVDSFDAMTSNRSYRRGLSTEEAVRELLSNAGTQFDSDIVDIFVERVVKYKAIQKVI